jgi:small subunit ribosomal protein S14
MAKKSSIEKNNRRRRMTKSAAPKRARLKAIIMDKDLSAEERFTAQLKLAEMPRNGAKIRIRNRCELTGRSRAVYRRFKLSRIMLRKLASEGQIPGVTKSSW